MTVFHCAIHPTVSRSFFFLLLYFTPIFFFFFFNDTATTEIYTLSLHDALPICLRPGISSAPRPQFGCGRNERTSPRRWRCSRSEEHTSELQSPDHLVCRLLLEKKKKKCEKINRSVSVYFSYHTAAHNETS